MKTTIMATGVDLSLVSDVLKFECSNKKCNNQTIISLGKFNDTDVEQRKVNKNSILASQIQCNKCSSLMHKPTRHIEVSGGMPVVRLNNNNNN